LRERPGIGSMYLEYYMSIDSVQAGIENVAKLYPKPKTDYHYRELVTRSDAERFWGILPHENKEPSESQKGH
jgi:hypothetical protein